MSRGALDLISSLSAGRALSEPKARHLTRAVAGRRGNGDVVEVASAPAARAGVNRRVGLPPHSSRIMASGRCSGGGWSSEAAAAVLGCLGGGGGDDEAADNAPAEVREVALEPASPTPAGETYEQHLARARSPRRPPPQNAAGDDDSGDEIIQAAAARAFAGFVSSSD